MEKISGKSWKNRKVAMITPAMSYQSERRRNYQIKVEKRQKCHIKVNNVK